MIPNNKSSNQNESGAANGTLALGEDECELCACVHTMIGGPQAESVAAFLRAILGEGTTYPEEFWIDYAARIIELAAMAAAARESAEGGLARR